MFRKDLIDAAHTGNLDFIKRVTIYKPREFFEFLDDMLITASCGGHLDVVKYVVEYGADIHIDDEYPLVAACENGKLDIVKYLISQGADPFYDNDYDLCASCARSQLDIILYLLSIGADINCADGYPLYILKRNRQYNLIRIIKNFYNQ